MIWWRWTEVDGLPVTIRPPFDPRENAMIARSISPASRTPMGEQLHPERRRHRLDGTPLASAAYGGLSNDRRSRHSRRDLFEQLDPFSAHAVFVDREPGHVAARACQTLDQACTDRVGDPHKHDWNGGSRLLQCDHERGAAGCQDNVRCKRDQFRRVFTKAVWIASGPAVVDLQVAADGPTQFPHTLLERD